MVARDRKIAGVVLLQFLPALGAVEQHEGGEVRQLDSFVEDQRRFHAAVGQENAAAGAAAGRVGIWPFQHLRKFEVPSVGLSHLGQVRRCWCLIVSRLPRRLVVRMNLGP